MTECSLVPRHRPLESCMAGPGNEASRKYKVQNFADSACTGFIFTAIPVNLAGYTGIWQVKWHHAEMLCRVSSVINLLWWCLLYYTLPVVMWFCNDNLCWEFHIATTPAWLLYGFMHLSSWILLYRYSHLPVLGMEDIACFPESLRMSRYGRLANHRDHACSYTHAVTDGRTA